jgi:transposase
MAVDCTGFVGIDVAQDTLVMSIGGDAPTTWANDADGHAGLLAVLREQGPTLIVLEGTGGLEQPVAAVLADAGLAVAIVNPRQVRDYAKGTGRRAKTDAIDAVVLAEFASVVPIAGRVQTATQALKALVARRRQVVKLRTGELHRRRRAHAVVQDSVERLIAHLTEELQTLEAAIAARVTLDPRWQAKRAILESVPGVAKVSAFTLIAELPELGTLTGKQIAALVGVAPRNNQSGRQQGPEPIGGGRAPVRSTLFQATVAAVRFNPVVRAFYDRLIAGHKPRKVALVAAERKLLVILNAMIHNGTMWQPALVTESPMP